MLSQAIANQIHKAGYKTEIGSEQAWGNTPPIFLSTNKDLRSIGYIYIINNTILLYSHDYQKQINTYHRADPHLIPKIINDLNRLILWRLWDTVA